MKIEDAIETIAIMKAMYSHIRKSDKEWDTLELAKEALEKQIPKLGKASWINVDECPSCGREVYGCAEYEPKFCPDCGQAIKWEVTP